MNDFNDRLEYGRVAEEEVSDWLIERGWEVIPTIPKPGLGQKMFGKNGNHNCPDLLVFKNNKKQRWVEVKRRTKFNSFGSSLTVGIKVSDLEDYLYVQQMSQINVYIFFCVQKDKSIWGEVPSGMYSQSLNFLIENIHSRTEKSVFWNRTSLTYEGFYE